MAHHLLVLHALSAASLAGVMPLAPVRRSTAGTWTPSWTPAIGSEGGCFEQDCNRRAFSFEHDVAASGLFNLPELIALARRRPADWEYAHWANGHVAVDARWEQGTEGRRSLEETLAGIAGNDSLVMLRHAEQDTVFGPVICNLFERLVEMCGPEFRRDVISGHSEIIVSSPRRITSYHIDADCNFLFQIAGGKQLKVYPAHDGEVIRPEDLERYHCGDYNGAHYRSELEPRAVAYQLRQGRGIHIPSTSPHCAVSDDQVSIGLSCAFDLRSMSRQALICQLNRRLRGLGLDPTPPGVSPWRDALKLGVKRSLAVMGRATDKYTGAAAGEWRPGPSRGPISP